MNPPKKEQRSMEPGYRPVAILHVKDSTVTMAFEWLDGVGKEERELIMSHLGLWWNVNQLAVDEQERDIESGG